jgi:DNA adenine methylase
MPGRSSPNRAAIAKPRSGAVRPLLKWAGGKRQLLPQLRRFYPRAFRRYIEPFFGSGAVFFDLYGAGRLRNHDAVLIDSNADLIGCYEVVRDCPDEVARELDALAAAHAMDGPAHYYAIRDGQFNPLRARLRRGDGHIAYTAQLAAMLIYLNRTGFNGLFRLNASGAFNVPAGRYAHPTISDRGNLRGVAEALAGPRVRLRRESFESAVEIAEAGDFLYLDPPYAPLSATAKFTSYTASGFSLRDQERLQRVVIALASRGCHVLVSNSTAEDIAALYDTSLDARTAGLRTTRVPARRAVNSDATRRGPVEEFLISNVEPEAESAVR